MCNFSNYCTPRPLFGKKGTFFFSWKWIVLGHFLVWFNEVSQLQYIATCPWFSFYLFPEGWNVIQNNLISYICNILALILQHLFIFIVLKFDISRLVLLKTILAFNEQFCFTECLKKGGVFLREGGLMPQCTLWILW